MIIKAYAKINLSLDVIGKREEDGYHLLKMIMQNIELYDLITLEEVEKNINITCNKKYIPTDERNLVYKAAKLFMDTYNIQGGINMDIKKNIPVAAGLAGGSADAAAVLKAMNILYDINETEEKLMELGLKIGADVPYCIFGGTALCEGIGEIITPLKAFKHHIVVLVKPNFGMSTKEVYKSLNMDKIFKHPNTGLLIQALERNDLNFIAKNMKNILENITIKKHIILKDIKHEMDKGGALGSMMSGSGPTIFGFFDDMLKAQRCFEKFKDDFNDVYITRTI